jgi:co-chaperonin GroES (HSP10)
MTALSSSASMPWKNLPAASSSRTPPRKSPPSEVIVGDRVLFGKWSGTEVKIDGQELLIMKESDIMGIIDEPAAKKKAA